MSNFSISLGMPSFPTFAAAPQANGAQGAQGGPTAAIAASAQIQDGYLSAGAAGQANMNGQAGLAIRLGAGAAGNPSPMAILSDVGRAIAGAASSAWNFLASHLFPGNPPLPQAPSQPAKPSGLQFDAMTVASMEAKYASAFDKADVNQDGQLTGTELQNGVVNFDPDNIGTVSKAEFVQQGVASEEDARNFAANQATHHPAAAARTIGALYQNSLGRMPTVQELDQALKAMAQGTTSDDLQATLQSSPEAKLRASYKAVFGHDFIGTSRSWYLGQLKEKGSLDAVKQQMLQDRAFYQKNGVGY